MNSSDDISLSIASEMLREVGLRRTIARINLLKCLADQTTPLTQAEITEKLSPHGFDSSTVFRGLTDLTEAGLVVRIDAGDRIWRFELHDRNPDGTRANHHHPHIYCHQCGQLVCLEYKIIEMLRGSVDGWGIEDLIICGTCPDCHEM